MESSGIEVDIIHLNQLMNLYANLGDWERAWGLMGLIGRRKLTPRGDTYATLIKACDMCASCLPVLGFCLSQLMLLRLTVFMAFAPAASWHHGVTRTPH